MDLALVMAVILSALAAVFDMQSRKIPNWLTMGGLVLILVVLLWQKSWTDMPPHLMSLFMGTVVGVGSFAMKVMGGGDGKLIMMVSLAVPFVYWGYLMLAIAVMGGVQALIMLLIVKDKKQMLPYGLAIFLGTLGFYIWKLYGFYGLM